MSRASDTSTADRRRGAAPVLATVSGTALRLAGGLCAALALSGCSLVGNGGDDRSEDVVPLATAVVPRSMAGPAARAARPAATPRPGVQATAAAAPASADAAAGLRSRAVPQRGKGRLLTVPGDVPAPGDGRVMRVSVQVEKGLDVDGAAFARFVMDTLNDDRSWGHGATRTFARTDGDADFRVVLASPDTSAAMCAPLRTNGTLSCRNGDAAVLTLYRWVKATPDYGGDRTAYRRYVVNHEVGHVLGKGHVSCPGKGRRAPVMMQQTKGLRGCTPNPWPFP